MTKFCKASRTHTCKQGSLVPEWRPPPHRPPSFQQDTRGRATYILSSTLNNGECKKDLRMAFTCTRNRGIGQRRDRQGHKSPTPPRLHRSLRRITLSKFPILQQQVYHLGWSRKKSSQGPFSGKWSCLGEGRASSLQGSSPSSS